MSCEKEVHVPAVARTLGEMQRRFTRACADLIIYAYDEMGYELATEDGYRDPRVFGLVGTNKTGSYGHKSSAHKSKLAHDWSLFIDGVFQETTKAHAKLGAYWEGELGPKYDLPLVWGGRFNDGNHYSCKYLGRM